MAGETENIGKIADILSQKLFREFGWTWIGPTNENFPCNAEDEHGAATHPADVVFYYDDPYSNDRVYVLFDLKSFAAKSIKSGNLRSALLSLSKSIACAGRSDEWRKRYDVGDKTVRIVGALFVYNHDNDYKGSFSSLVETAVSEDFSVGRRKRIVVFGPDEIAYLNTVANDMKVLRGEDLLPKLGEFSFHYPDLVLHRKRILPAAQATVELLTGPLQVVTFASDRAKKFVVYYRNAGASVDEFLYLFDYFFRFQMLDDSTQVQLRMVDPDPEAPTIFKRAVEQYADLYAHHILDFRKIIRERLDAVSYSAVQNVTSQFSNIAIGMGYVDE